jgi:hypothetical protein
VPRHIQRPARVALLLEKVPAVQPGAPQCHRRAAVPPVQLQLKAAACPLRRLCLAQWRRAVHSIRPAWQGAVRS